MNIRIRLLIISVAVCHLLLAHCLVTSQLQGGQQNHNWDRAGVLARADSDGLVVATLDQDNNPKPATCQATTILPVLEKKGPQEEVTIRANEQEKEGDIYKLRGDVEIKFLKYTFRADQVTYDHNSGEITAEGHLVFDGGPHDEHITATHGHYNMKTDSGRFFDVVGSTGAKLRGRNVVLTSSSPFSFTGKIVDKEGRDKIIVHHGTVTSCNLPQPKWLFRAERVVVVAGEDAKIYHSTFRLFGVPIFYFPFVDHPVESLGRKSGFLIPTIGQSSQKGTFLGDSFYWAINRSMDATIGAEYYSKRGWAQIGQFRAKPSKDASVDVKYYGVLERGRGLQREDQGGQEVRANAASLFPKGFRGVADIDYLSSYFFRLSFSDTFNQAINSEVKSTLFLSNNYQGYSINVMASRYQNFQSSVRGDVVMVAHAPSVDVSSVDRKITGTPLYWSFDTALGGLSRSEPTFVTPEIGRLDVGPSVTLPLLWRGWSLRPEVGVRETFYTDRLIPGSGTTGVGVVGDTSINRNVVDASVEMRPPALSRIFEKPFLGQKVKHTIEPRLIYHYVAGVNNFQNILRFDERDILSDTNEVEYGIVNRFYTKRTSRKCEEEEQKAKASGKPQGKKSQECDESSREAVTWEVRQKYFLNPTFGGAVVDGRRNVFTTSAELTGIAFITGPLRLSPIVSQFRIKTAANADIEWHLDYDTTKGRISSSIAFVNYKFLKDIYIGGAHAYLQSPGEVVTSSQLPVVPHFNQFRVLLQYGQQKKRGLNAATSIGFDANLGFLQYSAFQTTYNWDCCGLSFEYRRFSLGAVRNENQFRFALSLANVGTFGTLRKQERLF